MCTVLLAGTFFLPSAENEPRPKHCLVLEESSLTRPETRLLPWLLFSGCWLVAGGGGGVEFLYFCTGEEGDTRTSEPRVWLCPLESCKGESWMSTRDLLRMMKRL